MVTLGHNRITSYLEFIKRLMEMFDRRDIEFHFIYHRVPVEGSGCIRYFRAQVGDVIHRGIDGAIQGLG
jgi:hypothetical protein